MMKKAIAFAASLLLLLLACGRRGEVSAPEGGDEGQTGTQGRDPKVCVIDYGDQEESSALSQVKALEVQVSNFVKAKNTASIRSFESKDVTIPVVVHVIYNRHKLEENISAAQIQSQIEALNRAFNPPKSDIERVPEAFQPSYAGDTQIRFVLQEVTRTPTDRTVWAENLNRQNQAEKFAEIKRADRGGVDAIRPDKYLNIWVCKLAGNIAGAATLPYRSNVGHPQDGVITTTTAFGTQGYVNIFTSGGATAVHEVGHWLGLYHMWGRNLEGGHCTQDDDFVADTPPSSGPHLGCITAPLYRCGVRQMTMNYMDYGNDPCIYMFTKGQRLRMRAVLHPDGPRGYLSRQ